jgi:hypothetical protein
MKGAAERGSDEENASKHSSRHAQRAGDKDAALPSPPPPPHPPPTNLAHVQLLAAQAARATREYRARTEPRRPRTPPHRSAPSRFRTGTTLRSGTDDIARKRCVSYYSCPRHGWTGWISPESGKPSLTTHGRASERDREKKLDEKTFCLVGDSWWSVPAIENKRK